MVERPQLLAMAAEIVSAHVRYNAVAVDQLPGVIQQVFNALATAEQAVTPRPKTEPAVPVRRSVLADHVVCLDCGKHLTMLKRHLMTDHKLTPDQYRQRWELPFLVPIGRPELCQDPIHAREEVRAWSYGVSRTEESGTKSCSEGGTASASHRVSLATVQQDASC